MNKQQKQELKNNLKTIESTLNKHNVELEYWTYKLLLKNNEITVNIFDEEFLEETFAVDIAEIDIKSILKSFVNKIYTEEINYRKSFIKGTKAFNSRKIKSMSLWMDREKYVKVQKINEDLVERYKTSKKFENEINVYKSYVRDFYKALWILCPSWKTEDIKEKLEEMLKRFNMNAELHIKDNNYIVAKNDDNIAEIAIDGFTTKERAFIDLKNKLVA